MSSAGASIVMILGSEAHFIYLVRYYTERSGHQAFVAPIDEEAIALAEQEKPAMIVLEPDLMLPASRDLLRALKTNRATRDIPVVVCSWQDEDTSILASEADSYLQKPISYEGFLAALKEVAHISGT
jgi:DNA-binding response OmpR family regulator